MSAPLLARDVMVSRLVTLLPQVPVMQGMRLLIKRKITGAPVVDREGKFQGVFSERSCLNVVMQLLSGSVDQSDPSPAAQRIMAGRLITLDPEDDVLDAIGRLLKYKVSGVPIVDKAGAFRGVFSEKTSMNVILQSAFDQVPSGPVRNFADTDEGRKVVPETLLGDVVQTFLATPYRRLVVVNGDRVIGQISRRDAIRAALDLIDRMGVAANMMGSVSQFMRDEAKTIGPDLDLLSVAQIFQQTNFRRLPIVADRDLQGQLSRRDVLAAFHKGMAPAKEAREPLLYLSSLHRREDAPIS